MKEKYFLKLLFLLISVFGIVSCKHNPGFEINGEFPAYPGASVSLMHETVAGWEVISKTRLDTKGFFRFSGELDYPEYVYITVDNNRQFVRFFLENKLIKIKVDKDSLLRDPEITGSEIQEKFNEFEQVNKTMYSDTLAAIYKHWQLANRNGDKQTAAELDSLRSVFFKRKLDYQIDFVKNNSDNILAPFILNLIYTDLDMIALTQLTNQLEPGLDSTLYVLQIKQKIHAINATKPGQAFLDFSLPDSIANKFSLSDLAGSGNLLILDFWASWSGKCLLETDLKRDLYNKYFERGVEFVSVSLDVNKIKWLKTIDEFKMPWIQLIDEQGPRGLVAKEYLITGLPVKFILDQEGKIICKIQTAEELESELKAIFE
ncbi:MAG: AhpC/TSA family protein [Bacteroidales bacterium]|nr:AhpC/TSA family protein [Bacteroidales bacterium]